jgi:hypothetical protein
MLSVLSSERRIEYRVFDFASASCRAVGGAARAAATSRTIRSRTYGVSSGSLTRAKIVTSSGSALGGL